MLYTKPHNMKYTDMAIYIDAHVPDIIENNKNPNIEENIFKYLYLICYTFACKKKFFQKFEDYDGYALYAASQFYLRLKNQYIKYKEDPANNKPIKSCLNYINNVLYPLKVNYQKQTFFEVIQPEVEKNFNVTTMSNKIREGIQSDYRYGIEEEMESSFKILPLIIKRVCNETPYVKDKLMMKNIYMSCLLSFLNNITIPNIILQKAVSKNKLDYAYLNKIYTKEESNCIILWHIDESMASFIRLLLNKIKKEFSKELEDTKNSFDLDNNTLDDILASAYATYDCNNNSNDSGDY